MRLFCILSIARRNISENGAFLEISCSFSPGCGVLEEDAGIFLETVGTSGFEVLLEVK